MPVSLAPDTQDTVELIDVLWLDRQSGEIRAAFEVEKSTSACRDHLYLVAPEGREREIIMQLSRPSLTAGAIARPAYILFKDLSCHCEGVKPAGATTCPTWYGNVRRGVSKRACR